MRELRSRVIINERSKLKMVWYANIFCEGREPDGDDNEHSEWQCMLGAIENKVSGREHSDWQEASGSAVSDRFELSKSVWNLLFHVGMIYLGVLSVSPHVCIFCSVAFGISLYCIFVRYILHFIYCPKKWRVKISLKITLFWIKKYFGSVYINPNDFFPICSHSFKHWIAQLICTNTVYSL